MRQLRLISRLLGVVCVGVVASCGDSTSPRPVPTELFVDTQPSGTVQAGVALAAQPVVHLRNASHISMGNAGVVVTATTSAPGVTVVNGTATTGADGAAHFTSLTLTGLIGSVRLHFTSGTLTPADAQPITLTAGSPSKLALTSQPSTAATAGVALAQQPVVQLQDAWGNAAGVAGTVVTAAIASGGGALSGTATATTNASGVATFTNLQITGTIGARTLSFSAPSLTGATSGTITLAAGAASQLAITTQPSTSAQSGAAFGQQPAIQIQDAWGNAASAAGTVVTAAIASGGGTLGGTATATTNASGLATFTNLQVSGTIGARTLSFSAPSLTGATSGTITLAAGAAAQLVVTTQPSGGAQSGVAFAQQPVIQLQDAAGNAVGEASVVVTATIASGGGTLGGTATATTNASGVAAFADLSVTGATGDRTLTFSAPSLTSATSGTITLAAGLAGQLAITTQPSSSAQSAVAFAQQPVVQLQDAAGNAVSEAGTVVTATIASGGGTLGGTTTATTNASGVATFTDLHLTGTVGARTLTFSAPSLTSATSGTITLGAGVASMLAIVTQPSTGAQSGVTLAQQPAVQIQDAGGNNVAEASVVVTAAIASGGGTLGGTLTATTDATGLATFTNLQIAGTIGDRTLSFSAPSLTGATSGTVTLSAGAASQLVITTQPSTTAASGTALAIQPHLQLEDASGNAVSQANVIITASVVSGTVTIAGGTATTNASGAATFSGLTLTGAVASYTLKFTSATLATATAAQPTALATKLALTTQPSTSSTSELRAGDPAGRAAAGCERGGGGGGRCHGHGGGGERHADHHERHRDVQRLWRRDLQRPDAFGDGRALHLPFHGAWLDFGRC